MIGYNNVIILLTWSFNGNDNYNHDWLGDRYLEQRRADALKRIEVSKQRKHLYDLIATDKITAIFNARAHNTAGDDDSSSDDSDRNDSDSGDDADTMINDDVIMLFIQYNIIICTTYYDCSW